MHNKKPRKNGVFRGNITLLTWLLTINGWKTYTNIIIFVELTVIIVTENKHNG